MPVDEGVGTGARRTSAYEPAVISRRQVVIGLVGLPGGLVLAACTSGPPGPAPSSQTPSGAATTSTPTSATPVVDAPALVATAAAALTLLATYEMTTAVHPTLGPVLAPYAADHDAHLQALGERVTLPTPSSSTSPSPAVTTTTPTRTGPVGPPTVSPTTSGTPVPADPTAARAEVVRAEQVAGEEAATAARGARDGEVARLLASVAASRAVHALLLGVPA